MQPSAQTNAVLRARMEQLLGEYEQLRRDLAAARERMRGLSGAASTSDGTVTVGVDAQGRPNRLEIDPKAYRRFSPSQLAAEILRLYAQAGREVTGKAAEVMAPFLPADADYAALVGGEADIAAWAPGQPLTDENFDEWRARFSGRPTTAPPSQTL